MLNHLGVTRMRSHPFFIPPNPNLLKERKKSQECCEEYRYLFLYSVWCRYAKTLDSGEYVMKKILLTITGLTAVMMLAGTQLFAAVGDLSVIVPKTAYVEWLTNSTDAMTSVNGDNSASFADYVGGASTQLTQPANKDTYIGVMCNALTGYNLTLNGGAGATATTGKLTLAGATDLVFTATLVKEASTFTAGTTAGIALDLTGATVSGDTVHTAEADLPLTAASPNVWKLTYSLPTISSVADGLIMSGTYSGGVTATIALK